MSEANYKTTPPPIDTMPKGVSYIVGNEAAERFSYYGMRTILVIFMTKYLMSSGGGIDPMSETEAKKWYHLFLSSVYFFPVIGAILSDWIWGKYRTILWLSVVYCLGHLALALDETRLGLSIGLGLIAIGSGGIKPCVSAHVGDQFGESNKHLISRVFGWFYWSINFGAFISTLLTPWLLDRFGPHIAFGVPGLLMLIATWVFWLGRKEFVHIPPGGKAFLEEALGPRGIKSLASLVPIYLLISIFWALYDQSGSSWVLQANNMDLNFLGHKWLASQVQAMNPILVLIYIPLFTYVLYPWINSFFPLSSVRKMGLGFFVMLPSFLIIAFVESGIQAGQTPSIAWHILAYVFLTAAEVMTYQTGLELTYTQAPNTMKSFLMSLYLLTVSLGNFITGFINGFIANPDGTSKLEGVSYYLFFSGLMAVAAVAFIFVAKRFKETSYIQGAPEAEGNP